MKHGGGERAHVSLCWPDGAIAGGGITSGGRASFLGSSPLAFYQLSICSPLPPLPPLIEAFKENKLQSDSRTARPGPTRTRSICHGTDVSLRDAPPRARRAFSGVRRCVGTHRAWSWIRDPSLVLHPTVIRPLLVGVGSVESGPYVRHAVDTHCRAAENGASRGETGEEKKR